MKTRFWKNDIPPRHLEVAFDDEKALNFPVGMVSSGARATAGRLSASAPEAERQTLLLLSNDAGLGARLSCTAELAGLAFLQFNDSANALRQTARCHPAVVCVDLDLPESAVWETAEGLLQDETCPALVLLSGRSDHEDLGAAIHAGAIVHKSAEPAKLLERVDGALDESTARRAEQKARQRLLVRWLRPYRWPIPVEPTARLWGINE